MYGCTIKGMSNYIDEYNNRQEGERKEMCQILSAEIAKALPDHENKMWHGSPVWFDNGNPIAAYDALKDCIRIFFWSGQSFAEPGLSAEGSFKAAEKRYTSVDQIDTDNVQRWLQKAQDIQWDYKNIVKRKGKLERIK